MMIAGLNSSPNFINAAALMKFGLEFNPAIIIGGQIAGERPRLFNVYAAGNFIEATPDTTYFPIGARYACFCRISGPGKKTAATIRF